MESLAEKVHVPYEIIDPGYGIYKLGILVPYTYGSTRKGHISR